MRIQTRRITSRITSRTARRSAGPDRRALATDLATYTSPADLIELSAILEQYDDAETDEVRRLVDWSRAA